MFSLWKAEWSARKSASKKQINYTTMQEKKKTTKPKEISLVSKEFFVREIDLLQIQVRNKVNKHSVSSFSWQRSKVFFPPCASKVKTESFKSSCSKLSLFFFSWYSFFLSVPFNDRREKMTFLVTKKDHRSKKPDFSQEMSSKPESGVRFSGFVVTPCYIEVQNVITFFLFNFCRD